MAERDWNKDLAKIDQQIARMPADAEAGAAPPAARGSAPASRGSVGGGAEGGGKGAGRPTHGFGVYARLTLSVVLGIAIVVWPYEARCGAGLAAYLAAVIVVAVSGGWSAVWTWRHRAARAHVLSLLILLWGLVLGSMEILPRVGYARADLQHPAGWLCK